MERNNRLFTTLMTIFIIATVTLGGFIVYDKLIKKDNNELECSKCTNQKCDCSNSVCTKKGVAGEQMIYSKIGLVYVSDNGEVYFDPSEDAKELGVKKDDILNKVKELLGNANNYEVKNNKIMEGHHTFKYKLDLPSVQSVSEFEFGNGGVNFSLLFVHDDGTISELSYEILYDEGDLKLYKNVSGYTDIVSIVADHSEDGYGAKIYDKCGNGIDYTSPRFNNN